MSQPAAIVLSIFFGGQKNLREEFDGDTSLSGIIDDYGFYDDDSEKFAELEAYVRDTAEMLEMNVIIYLSGDSGYYRTDDDIDDYAAKRYDDICGKDTDGVFLYLDICGKSPAYDLLSCSGKAGVIYGRDIVSIVETANSELPPSGHTISENQLTSAIINFCVTISSRYENYKPNSFRWEHDKYTGKYFYYKNGEFYVTKKAPPVLRLIIFAIASVIGAVIAIICYYAIRSRYKFKTSANPGIYVAHGETHLQTAPIPLYGATLRSVRSNRAAVPAEEAAEEAAAEDTSAAAAIDRQRDAAPNHDVTTHKRFQNTSLVVYYIKRFLKGDVTLHPATMLLPTKDFRTHRS